MFVVLVVLIPSYIYACCCCSCSCSCSSCYFIHLCLLFLLHHTPILDVVVIFVFVFVVVVLDTTQRMEKFGNGRNHVFYDEKLQQAHHIHFPADGDHRVLQHHYAFAFFANPDMQSFYRRFVRDYMRYRDEIQCAGAELVAAVRADSLKTDPSQGALPYSFPTPSPTFIPTLTLSYPPCGKYYALHIRRGDFQYNTTPSNPHPTPPLPCPSPWTTFILSYPSSLLTLQVVNTTHCTFEGGTSSIKM